MTARNADQRPQHVCMWQPTLGYVRLESRCLRNHGETESHPQGR